MQIELTGDMVPVQSSNIRAVGSAKLGALVIEFSNGGRYVYIGADVEPLHAQLLAAESKGSFFATHIKNNKALTCIKVPETPAPLPPAA